VQPADRYLLLAEAAGWSTNPGHPGYVTAAVDETFQRGIIPAMFARAARGDQSPEASVRAAEVEMRRIYSRWSK
jgi:multiple sugar transport system substrate-binding protein